MNQQVIWLIRVVFYIISLPAKFYKYHVELNKQKKKLKQLKIGRIVIAKSKGGHICSGCHFDMVNAERCAFPAGICCLKAGKVYKLSE